METIEKSPGPSRDGTLPAASAANRRKKSPAHQVTIISLEKLSRDRVEILKALAEYRWLLTKQIHSLVQFDEGAVQQTQGDLARLKDFGLIDSFVAYPEMGRASPYGWTLCKAGAGLLGIPYDSHFQRRPNAYQMAYREDQIEIIRQYRQAHESWCLLKPLRYSKAHPAPGVTDHSKIITQISYNQEVGWLEVYRQSGYDINELSSAVSSQAVIEGFPQQCNDYVAFSKNQDYGVVFVLFPPDVSEKTMLGRIELYRNVALRKKVYLYALFNNRQLVDRDRVLFEPTGWWGVAVPKEVSAIFQLVPQELRKARNNVLTEAFSRR